MEYKLFDAKVQLVIDSLYLLWFNNLHTNRSIIIQVYNNQFGAVQCTKLILNRTYTVSFACIYIESNQDFGTSTTQGGFNLGFVNTRY